MPSLIHRYLFGYLKEIAQFGLLRCSIIVQSPWFASNFRNCSIRVWL